MGNRRLYYAVARGREVGIYNSWGKTGPLVLRYKDALHKSFPTLEKASNFMADSGVVGPYILDLTGSDLTSPTSNLHLPSNASACLQPPTSAAVTTSTPSTSSSEHDWSNFSMQSPTITQNRFASLASPPPGAILDDSTPVLAPKTPVLSPTLSMASVRQPPLLTASAPIGLSATTSTPIVPHAELNKVVGLMKEVLDSLSDVPRFVEQIFQESLRKELLEVKDRLEAIELTLDPGTQTLCPRKRQPPHSRPTNYVAGHSSPKRNTRSASSGSPNQSASGATTSPIGATSVPVDPGTLPDSSPSTSTSSPGADQNGTPGTDPCPQKTLMSSTRESVVPLMDIVFTSPPQGLADFSFSTPGFAPTNLSTNPHFHPYHKPVSQLNHSCHRLVPYQNHVPSTHHLSLPYPQPYVHTMPPSHQHNYMPYQQTGFVKPYPPLNCGPPWAPKEMFPPHLATRPPLPTTTHLPHPDYFRMYPPPPYFRNC